MENTDPDADSDGEHNPQRAKPDDYTQPNTKDNVTVQVG
jgi:hypothetical protein